MNISEEKLEQRLRALFADERLDLPPPLDATKAIVEGAQRRRRRRRSMMTTTSVAAAVLVVSGGLAVFKIQSQDSAAVMSGGPPELSVRPQDNMTPGVSQPPAGSAPTSTGRIDPPPPSADAKPSKTSSQPTTKVRRPVTSGPLLAADAFGVLKLGMTEADVTAQGVTLTNKQAISSGCDLYDVSGGGVPATASLAISAANGLVIVTPASVAHTPEGIGAGSTKDDILAVYPGATDGTGGVVAPAQSVSEYHFKLDARGVVDKTSLYSTNQDCVG